MKAMHCGHPSRPEEIHGHADFEGHCRKWPREPEGMDAADLRQGRAANSNNTHFQFWRQDNRPVQLVTTAVFEQKLNYLHNNPVAEGYVELAEEYVYCSAPAIAGKQGLLNLEPC
jgi:hypothetical protein